MLWICNTCTAAYAFGALRCPQCGADNHRDEGTPKVKPSKTVKPVKADAGAGS